MTRLNLRFLTRDDLGFADSLRGIAGWNQTLADWQRFIDLSPGGCLLAECEGRPVATATTICYGQELAWIGMILVHPDFRRRGIARVLLRHCIELLRGAGIRCIKLDATPEGREVYRQLGFIDEFTLTRYAGFVVPTSVGGVLRTAMPSDLPQIFSLDQAATGAPREKLLQRLFSESSRALVLESAPNQITGFGFVRAGSLANYLGPIVASDRAGAELLATALLHESVFCDLRESGAAWAKTHGLTPHRTLTRMYLGQNAQPAAPETYFAIAAPDLG
jgi:GNAT superfamily N-acetyltransferase